MRTEPEVERLVRENLGLVGAVVSRTLRLFPRLPNVYDREDLHCVGSIGLLRAAQTYDPERGAAFSTYAYGCIAHAIAGALKRETSRQIECVSLSLLCQSPHHLTARSFTAGAREAERGSPLFSRGAGNSFGWPRSSALRR